MQEDVENRTINFAISTTKLTGRTILAAHHQADGPDDPGGGS